MFALDCEMCRTATGQLELTRISVVNENLEIVYDTLVKPFNKITDYLTRFSGITKQMLDPINVRLADVQKKIREILPPDAILIGQSLNCDLHAMQVVTTCLASDDKGTCVVQKTKTFCFVIFR